MKIKYCVIRYRPSFIREEFLNIGILGYCVDLNVYYSLNILDFESNRHKLLGYNIDDELFKISLNCFIDSCIKKDLIGNDFINEEEIYNGIFCLSNNKSFSTPRDVINRQNFVKIIERKYERYVEAIIKGGINNVRW